VIGTLDANRIVNLRDEAGTKLCYERHDRVEAFLQVFFGKYQTVKSKRIALRLLVFIHDLGRGFPGDFADLVFDFPAAGFKRSRERDIEAMEITAQRVKRGRNGCACVIETFP